MKRREFGERWSFIWLAILTFDLICGAFFLYEALQEKEEQVIKLQIETLETHEVRLQGTGTKEHVEQIEVKTLVNDEYLEMLAHLINGEAGSNWCSDAMQLGVGSVALNRVKDPRFPDNLHDVIYQKGQYACTWDGNYELPPSERAYANARKLLEEGSTFPEKVVFQANFTQGKGTYLHEQNMYFCY